MRSALIRFISVAAVFFIVPASAQTYSSASGKSIMGANQYLRDGEYLVADNKAFYALMQPDGNFCVFKGAGPFDTPGGGLWCFNVAPGKGSYFAIMQSDANLCVYRGTPENNQGLVKCAGTTAPAPSFAVLQGDGNLVGYRGTGPGDNRGFIWNSGKTSAVTWLPGGKQVCETAYNLCWGISDLKQVSLVSPSPSITAQKFVFMSDGTIRLPLDSATCVSMNWAPAASDFRTIIASLRLARCDHSHTQHALHYSNGSIKHNQHPEGCLSISDVRTGFNGGTTSRLLVLGPDCSKPGGSWQLK